MSHMEVLMLPTSPKAAKNPIVDQGGSSIASRASN
jgi:hypothetical protein